MRHHPERRLTCAPCPARLPRRRGGRAAGQPGAAVARACLRKRPAVLSGCGWLVACRCDGLDEHWLQCYLDAPGAPAAVHERPSLRRAAGQRQLLPFVCWRDLAGVFAARSSRQNEPAGSQAAPCFDCLAVCARRRRQGLSRADPPKRSHPGVFGCAHALGNALQPLPARWAARQSLQRSRQAAP